MSLVQESMVTFSVYGFCKFMVIYSMVLGTSSSLTTLYWRHKREQNKKRKEAARV